METKIVNPEAIKTLISKDSVFFEINNRYGAPPNWEREPGFESLSKIILGQQLSLVSAKAHFNKLKNYISIFNPQNILSLTDSEMRDCQISRQKASYLRALAKAVVAGELIPESLGKLEEKEIREQLTSVKGIGNWTAEVYMLFCLQLKDIFPVTDIAIIHTMRELYGVSSREEIVAISDNWRPFRSLSTYYLWHFYLNKRGRSGDF
jgi:DNA-3-methyladenine glycosylase II